MLTGCVLITGTSRGIGLEFVRQLVQRSSLTPKHIIATCRNPDRAKDLLELRDQHPEVVVVRQLDITEYDKLKGFVQDIKVQPLLVTGTVQGNAQCWVDDFQCNNT